MTRAAESPERGGGKVKEGKKKKKKKKMTNMSEIINGIGIGMELSQLSYNFIIFMPEIYLVISLIILLGYGVIYSKIGGIVNGMQKITHLTIWALIITLYIIIELNTNVLNDTTSNHLVHTVGGIDNITILIKKVIVITAIMVLIMSEGVYKKKKEKIVDFEYTQLIVLSTIGLLLLVSSRDLIVMYLSIETISLSLYIMAAIRKTGQLSTEAGLKYFILGALSSGLILFGCALVYVTTGLTDFNSLTYFIYNSVDNNLIGIEIGAIFIIFAILFKLAAAPFHMWAPDVYEGSPTIVTAYFAIVPKIGILLLLITLIYGPFLGIVNSVIKPLIIISGLLSIIIGSLGALNQTKIKRLLAYSAIGHMGFILLGVAPGTVNSLQATIIYIILYIIMSLNSFGFVLIYYNKYRSSINSIDRSYFISELSGLSRKEPVLAGTFALSLLSIAGIPPLAGFFSKYYVLLSLIENNMYLISIIAILFSVISCFYYIRIIQWMYFNNSKLYTIKDLADIAYSKVAQSSLDVYNNLDTKQQSITQPISNKYTPNSVELGTAIIMGMTFYVILTFLIYPNPLLIITFDSVVNTFI